MKKFYAVRYFLLVVLLGMVGVKGWGQNVSATWGANSNTAWYTGGNWAGGSYAGVQGNAASNSNIATFTSAFTGTSAGINMGTNSLNLGAISVDNTRITATNVGNSSSTAAGVLRLYGATVNSIANVILRNNGTGLLTLQASQSGTMGIVLSNSTDNIFQIDNSGGIAVSSIVSGSNPLTKAGTGTGVLTLSGVNTYTGATTVTGGELRLNPSANNSLSGAATFNGGTLATTGITASRVITFSSINLSNNSTLALASATAHTITFTSLGTLTSGKVLTITGWTGASYATGTTTGTNGKVFIGNTASLSATQLSQIRFFNGTNYYGATQLTTGELVPAATLVVTNPGNQTAGVGFSVTVTAKDLDGNARALTNATGITLTSSGIISGTTTGTISATGSAVTISGVVLAAGTGLTITATRSSGDQPIAGTSNSFEVATANTPTLSAGTISGSFGAVCINTTSGPQSFTLSGSALDNTNVVVSSTSAAYTFAPSSGGPYSNPLTLTNYNGTSPGTIYVKFSPTIVAVDNASITISGGGAANSATVTQSGNSGVNTPPNITTPSNASVFSTSATLGGNITAIGCTNITERGIYWSTTTGFPDGAGTKVSTTGSFSSTGAFTQSVTGLPQGTTVYFKAFAVNNGGTVYTTQSSITTNKAVIIASSATAPISITQSTTNNLLYQLSVQNTGATSSASVSITGLTFFGTYTSASGITNFKLYYNTNGTFSTTTLVSTLSSIGTSGSTLTFPSFAQQSIAQGVTGYFYITADVACAAIGNTIQINAITSSNITAATTDFSGTPTAGTSNTIVGAAPTNTTTVTPAIPNPGSGQISVAWATPGGCYSEVMVVVSPAANNGGIPSGDGTAYNANLTYGNGTPFGNGFVAYKGSTSPVVITGLTNGTTYYFKVFTRNGTQWSSGVEASATPALTYCTPTYSSGTSSGDYISLVQIPTTTLNNSSGASASPFYTIYPSTGSTTATLSRGLTYTLNVAGGSYATSYISAWIDWNQNGVFEASEFIGVSPNAGNSTTVTLTNSLLVPVSAVLGNTRLRIRSSDTSPGPTSGESCGATNSGFGEAEDYTVTIIINNLPTLTTTAISNVTVSSASSGGNVTDDGGSSVTARGVVWSTSTGPTIVLTTKTSDGIGTGTYTSSLTSLADNKTYYVRAYATNANGTSYGSEISFTTPSVSIPTATAATTITSNSFNANWSAVTGTTGYQLDVSTSATFGTSSTNTINEGFNTYTAGSTTYNGFTLASSTGIYTSAASSGPSGANSIQFNTSGDPVLSPTLAGAAISLSFWCKSNGLNSASFLVEGWNGSAWVTIQNIAGSSIASTNGPNGGSTFSYSSTTTPALPTNITQFRFTLTKSSGNLAFDDVSITYNSSVPSLLSGYSAKFISGQSTTSSTVSGLSANTTYYYRVRAVGANSTSGNSLTITVVTAPDAPTALVTAQPTCSIATGTITVTAPTGTGITYSIGGTYQASGTFSGVIPGTYNVTAQNTASSISAATVVTVNAQPATPVAPTVSVTQPTCSVATGTITVTSSTSGLHFSIDGSNYTNTSGIFSGVAAGTTYSVTAQNATCTSSSTPAVVNAQPATPAAPTMSVTQPTCSVATGTITVTSSTSGLHFSIDGLNYTNTSGIFSGVAAGTTYNVTAQNATCTSSSTPAVVNAQPATPATPTVNVTQPTCSVATGTITVTSPTTGVIYSIDGTNYQASATFSGVAAGTYSVTVKSTGTGTCVSSSTPATVDAQPPTPHAPTLTVTQPCPSGSGTINITDPTGPSVRYSIDGTNYQASGTFSNVAPGTYSVTARNGSGCISAATPATVNPPANYWTGAISNDWTVGSNWSCGSVPSATDYAIIPAAASLQPSLSTATAIGDLNIEFGAHVTMGSNSFTINGNAYGTGVLTGSTSSILVIGGSGGTGTVYLDQANDTTTNTLQNLTVSRFGNITIGNKLYITDVLNVTQGTFNTGDNIVLRSTSKYGTARVAPVTGSIQGNVTVERFMDAARSYRLVTPAVQTNQSIQAAWMEGQHNATTTVNNNNAPHFGTHITGPNGGAAGYDETATNNPSLYTFNESTQKYEIPANTTTSGALVNGKGYRLFIRGDRSINLASNSPAPTSAILRITGTLNTGDVTFNTTSSPALATNPGTLPSAKKGYALIGNPYASPVSWETITISGDVNDSYYAYDPHINARGAYVNYSRYTHSNSNPASSVSEKIQSGQAFFVQTVGPAPSIVFHEANKVAGNTNVFRTSSTITALSVRLLLNTNPGTENTADGTIALFDSAYSRALGKEDSYKLNNQDENIAIAHDTTDLSIEGRPNVVVSDTIQLKIWQYRQKSYLLRLDGSNFAPGVTAFVKDAYLNAETPVSLSDSTLIPFSLTADSASFAQNRFMIVFKSSGALPVTITDVKGYQKGKGIQVDWISRTETNIDHYEIEKSANGQQFEKSGLVKATGNNSLAQAYGWFDESPLIGANYYRIKVVERSGAVSYTRVVKVTGDNGGSMTVYPNPVKGNAIKLHLANMQKGRYTVTLYNTLGQKMLTRVIDHDGTAATYTISTGRVISKGSYRLHASNGEAEMNTTVMFE